MRIHFTEGSSLWKLEMAPQSNIVVLERSVAVAGIIEIARALARRAAREDHAQAVARRS